MRLITTGGFLHLNKINDNTFIVNLGKRFKSDTILISPKGLFKSYERPDNYQELIEILKKGDIKEIIQEVNVVYTYVFGIISKENINLSTIKLIPNCKSTLIANKLWLSFNIEENSILPYKSAIIEIKSKFDFDFQIYINNIL